MTKITPGMVAVVTGGGAGMGRQLCIQLCELGAKVATCDVNEEKLKETVNECGSAEIFTFKCDVSKEDECIAFKDATLKHFNVSHINLLFNNAGIGAGGSFVSGSRNDWEMCFNVCWYGVYYMSRAFMPSLISSKSGHIVNTSSVNGFWASIGPNTPHTSYSAAKFAVKGFTEALITDLRVNAPHVGVSLVCPGHIGTDIALNSQQKVMEMNGDDIVLEQMKKQILRDPRIPTEMKEFIRDSDKEQMRSIQQTMAEQFRNGGMDAAKAAKYILNGVQAGEWRILVGKDANVIDEMVRKDPESAYEVEFVNQVLKIFLNTSSGDNSNLEEQEIRLGLSKSNL